MTLREIADQIGVGEYPEVFEEIYKNIPQDAPACDLELIHRLQNEHNLFGDYYEMVCEAAEQTNADPAYSAWVKVNAKYALDTDITATPELPEFTSKETLVTDFLRFFVVLPQIPVSLESYKARGFSAEEVKTLLSNYRGSFKIVTRRTGRPGLDMPYFRWVTTISKARLFQTDGLQFELKLIPDMALWLRNRESGQLVPLILKGTFHACGNKILGARGFEDPTGSFTVTFSEDDENYYGHGSFDGVVSSEKKTFPKTEWECAGKPGDLCIVIHIPRGADISRETTLRAIENAKKIMKERYPEYPVKLLLGGSWLLNPQLKEMLGENSRIAQFLSCFTNYPAADRKGMAVLSFVYGRQFDNYEDMPVETTLHRKLKEIYVSGQCLIAYKGAIYL